LGRLHARHQRGVIRVGGSGQDRAPAAGRAGAVLAGAHQVRRDRRGEVSRREAVEDQQYQAGRHGQGRPITWQASGGIASETVSPTAYGAATGLGRSASQRWPAAVSSTRVSGPWKVFRLIGPVTRLPSAAAGPGAPSWRCSAGMTTMTRAPSAAPSRLAQRSSRPPQRTAGGWAEATTPSRRLWLPMNAAVNAERGRW